MKTEFASVPHFRQRLRFVAFFVVAMLWLNLLFVRDYWEGTKHGLTDFSVFYTAGTILREGLGHQLYDRQLQYEIQQGFTRRVPFRRGPLPFIHPPFEALIFWPLSWLNYRTAYWVWDAISVVMLVGVGVILRSCVTAFRLVNWKFTIYAFTFFPVVMCLLQGQDSILLLLFCTLALRAMKRESDVLAGCWLALGSLKFQFTLPIVALFFLWQRRRVLLGFLPVVLVLVLLSVAVSGIRSLVDYPRFALQVVETQNLGGVPLSLLPNLHGLGLGWASIPRSFGMMLVLAGSCLLFGYAVLKGGASDPLSADVFDLRFSLAIVVAVLVAWQTNIHDLSLLILPLALLINYGLGKRGGSKFHLLYPALALLIGPLWMVLWLRAGMVNLIAIPMIWWAWKIGKELSEGRRNVRAAA
jgi:hypothetical protein